MIAPAKRKYESARQLQRQSDILATVRAMLNEVGYEGMTIRALAKRAKVAQGTLYNLYGGKDGLVLAAVDELMTDLAGAAADGAPEEGIDAILALNAVMGEQIRATPRYADAMTRILFHVQPDDPLVDVLFARSLPFFKAQLAIAQRKGEVRTDVDTNVLARYLVGHQWGVVLLWMMGMMPVDDDDIERRRSDLMTLMGVATDAARKRLEARLEALNGA